MGIGGERVTEDEGYRKNQGLDRPQSQEPPAQLPEGYTPWEVYLYPPEGESSIIEIFLHPAT